ncbi:MAG: DUF421 domain-containing protein [Symbiobacteriia bacterium]
MLHLELPFHVALLQTFVAFVAVLVFAKLTGKEQIGQLTLYDYVNGITIGSIAGTIATDDPSKVPTHLLDLAVFAGLTFLVSYIALKSRYFRRLVEGTPTLVLWNGKVLERNLARNRYSVDELKAKLRTRDVFDPRQVQAAILETGGEVNVLLKAEYGPVTRKDLNVQTTPQSLPLDLVTEGAIHDTNLWRTGHDRDWLLDQLRQQGVEDMRDIVYAALDSSGQLYLDRRDDVLSREWDSID